MARITRNLDEAVARLLAGGLVAIPTETVYGLAAVADNPSAVASVYALKGRPGSNPLIVHIPSAEMAVAWASEIGSDAEKLMQNFWPGPLTLVLKARPEVSRQITAGQDTVALRVPAHPIASALLQQCGKALVAPSANRYMSVSPTTAEHVARQFAGDDVLILDGGPCTIGLESTIVGLLPGDVPRLLRPGMISADAVSQVLGRPLEEGANAVIRVPGQHRRHYAPATPAYGFSRGDGAMQQWGDDPLTGWLLCGQADQAKVTGPVIDLGDNPKHYARTLYDALYRLDASKLERMMIEVPPSGRDWLAIHNRLGRALQSRPVNPSCD